MRWRNRIGDLLARFRRQDEAVAAVEFALILPFLLALYLGSMEASALFTADRRINTISATMGDLVSQWDSDKSTDGKIPTTTMNDYFAAAQSLIYPMSTTGLKQVISGVQVNTDGTTKVLWSRAYNGGTARTVNSSYPLPSTKEMNKVTRETTAQFLVAAETYYSYKPLLGVVFTTALSLYRENLYLPRYEAKITLQ